MISNEMFLTESDKLIFNATKIMMDGLGLYLGNACELVLHSLESLQNSVIYTVNGHHSGRKIGAPITNLALEMLEDMEKSGVKETLTYFNQNKDGVTLKSCTIPILGEQERIIGLVCMNFYTNVSLHEFMSTFMHPGSAHHKPVGSIESFAENVDDLLAESVNEIQKEVYENSNILPNNRNKEIIIQLEEKGIFNIKDAVIKVANILNISKNTVYMHIRNNKNDSI